VCELKKQKNKGSDYLSTTVDQRATRSCSRECDDGTGRSGGKREEWNERLGQAKKGKLLFTAKTGAYWFVKTSKISIKSKNTSSYYF